MAHNFSAIGHASACDTAVSSQWAPLRHAVSSGNRQLSGQQIKTSRKLPCLCHYSNRAGTEWRGCTFQFMNMPGGLAGNQQAALGGLKDIGKYSKPQIVVRQ